MAMGVVAALYLLLVTAPAATPSAPFGTMGAATADPAGWRRIALSDGAWSGPGYSIAIPPGVQGGEVQGIDSDVAQLRGAGIQMSFDYGPYGSYSGCQRRVGCTERTETIDGRPAQIATTVGRMGGRVSARISLSEGPTVDLYADCANAAACARAVQMIRTIRFKR